MQLVRNTTPDGEGKYAVRRNSTGQMLDGRTGAPDEFFVLLLKDRHSQAALRAYAESVRGEDPEYASEIDALSSRAGPDSPHCKSPD